MKDLGNSIYKERRSKRDFWYGKKDITFEILHGLDFGFRRDSKELIKSCGKGSSVLRLEAELTFYYRWSLEVADKDELLKVKEIVKDKLLRNINCIAGFEDLAKAEKDNATDDEFLKNPTTDLLK
jgi:hypothetical protein